MCPDLEETMDCNTDKCPGTLFHIASNFHLNGLSVDCQVSQWKDWNCDVTCGNGTMTRERDVVQEPLHGGDTCPELEETGICQTNPCKGILFLFLSDQMLNLKSLRMSRMLTFHYNLLSTYVMIFKETRPP